MLALLGLGLSGWSVSAAQAIPAASKTLTAQVGGGFSIARSGFGYNYIKGFTAYGDVDYHQWIGVEANLHLVNVWTPDDIGETSIVVGPRVTFLHGDFNGRPRFVNVYAKFQGGLGFFQYQAEMYQPLTNRYRMLAYGGGIEFHVSRHLNVRPIELEYQRWPSYSERGLKPVVATFGGAYQF